MSNEITSQLLINTASLDKRLEELEETLEKMRRML